MYFSFFFSEIIKKNYNYHLPKSVGRKSFFLNYVIIKA